MARSTQEWRGKTDDARAPKKVRDRIRDRHPTCYICTRKFEAGEKVALDHVVALINGGENAERNLRPVHVKCHVEKTAADVAEKARIAAKRQKHRGIADEVHTIPGRQFKQSPRQAANQQRERLPMPAPRNLYTSEDTAS